MNLYKKNPEIEGTVCVNGELMDDDSIVFGKDFEMFADPKTFPGQKVILVRVDFNKLDEKQMAKLQQFEVGRHPKPPRHMGPITTANFKNAGDGSVKMSNKPDKVTPPKAPEPVTEKKKEPEKKTVEEIIQDEESEPVKIDEVFSQPEFVEDFAGVTDGNVKKVLKKFKTFDELAKASNTDLRAAGVRSNFFGRVRDRASEVLEEIAKEDTEE